MKFTRWLDKKRISEDLQKIIIDWMTEEELEMYPNAGGFATTDKKKIKFKKNSKMGRLEVGTHETNHFISGKKHFPTYINEGLTEYLTEIVLGIKDQTGYSEQVHFVKTLHEMLGDVFIKSYFLGDLELFNNKFAELLCNDGKTTKEEALKRIDEFYEKTNERHSVICSADLNERRDKKNINLDEVKKMIHDVILCKIREDAKNFKFYKNGKLDLNLAYSQIKTVLTKNAEWIDSKDIAPIMYTGLMEVINNSHLSKKSEERKEEILNPIFYKNQDGKINGINNAFDHRNLDKLTDDEEMVFKLFELKFKNPKENISIMDFVKNTTKIIDAGNVSEREYSALISQYLLELYGDKFNPKKINDLIKQNLGKIRNLIEIQEKNKENVIDTEFRKIDENEYIEKKDNRFYYMLIDEKNGEILEIPFDNNSEVHNRNNTISLQRNGLNEYTIRHNGIFKRKLNLGNSFDDINLLNLPGYYSDMGIMQFNDFFETELLSSFVKNLNCMDYVQIENDAENPYEVDGVMYTVDIDARSRSLDIKKLQKDLEIFDDISSDNISIKRCAIEKILDKVYRTQDIKNSDENISQLYESIKKELVKELPDEEKIVEATSALNQFRKDRIRKNGALVIFENDEARINYEKKQERKAISKLNKMYDQFKAFEYCEIMESAEVPKKNTEFVSQLAGVFTVLGSSGDKRSRKLDIDGFVDMVKANSNYDGDKNFKSYRENMIKKITLKYLDKIYNVSFEKLYFDGFSNTQNNNLLERKRNENSKLYDAYNFLYEGIVENILNGKKLDKTKQEEAEMILDSDRKNREKENIVTGYIINNPATRQVYEQLSALQSILTSHEFESVSQGLINAHNLMLEKGEKNAETK